LPQGEESARKTSRDTAWCGLSRDESGERFAAESKQTTQHTRIRETFKLTLAALVTAATTALVVNAGATNVFLGSRAAQTHLTVISGVTVDPE
jgi:hypothetical protein